MAYSVRRAPRLIFDRPYNAHTQRIIATASTNVIHLDQSKHEKILTVRGTKKNQRNPLAKNNKYSAFEVSLSRVDIETLNNSQLIKYNQLFGNVVYQCKMKHEHIHLSAVETFKDLR